MSISDEAREFLNAGAPSDWARYACAGQPRYAMSNPGKRRRCPCGCGQRSTYAGCANGLALMSGCEVSVRHWVGTVNAETL